MKKGLFAKAILIFCFIFITVFTVVVLINFIITGYEPSSLIQWVYTFWGCELVLLILKKVFDKKQSAAAEKELLSNYSSNNLDDSNRG